MPPIEEEEEELQSDPDEFLDEKCISYPASPRLLAQIEDISFERNIKHIQESLIEDF